MGGQIFKSRGIETHRLPAQAALTLANRIMPALRSVEHGALSDLHFSPARLVPSYRSKPDYGDLDVIVSGKFVAALGDEAIRAGVEEQLGIPVAMCRPDVRDPVLALAIFTEEHGPFQVDLITAEEASFDFTARYFSWNDTGSYVARVARQMGLRFGQNGLVMVLSGAHNSTVPVTTDMDSALEFLGYDAGVHRTGFDDRKGIFDFIAAGRYFDPAIYEMDRMTNRARARARKRPLYSEFIEAMRARPARYHWPIERSETDLAKWEAEIFEAFPGTQVRRDALLEEQRRERNADSFFSGARATKLSGVSGRGLMHLMHAVRTEFATEDDFREWTSLADEEDFARRLKRNLDQSCGAP